MFVEDEKEATADALQSITDAGYHLPKFTKKQKGEYICDFQGFSIKVNKKVIAGTFGEQWSYTIHQDGKEVFTDDYYRAKSCKVQSVLYILEAQNKI